jgi:hypothetical protein
MLAAYTLFHVALSLVGIASGFIVLVGLLTGNRQDRWTKVFLLSTVLTSVTGFFFPVQHFMPSHGVGIISLVLLALAIYARYPKQLAGGWRKTYVVTAVLALYLNCFVFIVQSFMKIPALKSLAPTQSEPPFQIAQLTALVAFIILTVLAAIKFKKEAA